MQALGNVVAVGPSHEMLENVLQSGGTLHMLYMLYMLPLWYMLYLVSTRHYVVYCLYAICAPSVAHVVDALYIICGVFTEGFACAAFCI